MIIRDRRLRWPVARGLEKKLAGQSIFSVDPRDKYLLINTSNGTAILHLGMTGSVFIVDHETPAGIHNHFDFELDSGKTLRFRDPRRFGSFHWSKKSLAHPLLAKLGPEPLSDDFGGEYLWQKSRGRKVSVKQFIMNAQIVVGVGNFYASKSLPASIRSARPAVSPDIDTMLSPMRSRTCFGVRLRPAAQR